jgi:hypothetical protein
MRCVVPMRHSDAATATQAADGRRALSGGSVTLSQVAFRPSVFHRYRESSRGHGHRASEDPPAVLVAV